jgi:hypothetical protein
MEEYSVQNNITFSDLLLVYNDSTHSLDFEQLCPDIEVVFMSLKITSVMQPLARMSLPT